MVSIVATLLGGRVVATDLADHLEMLSININENISDYKTCFVKALEWGNFEDIIKIKTFGICDLILCSDLVYLPELYDPLVDTLSALSSKNTLILLAQRRRYEREKIFFDKVKLVFTINKIYQHDSIAIYEMRKLIAE